MANAEALTEEEIAKQVADEMQAAADARAEETKQNLVVPTPPKEDSLFTVALERGPEGLGLDVDHYRKGATIGYVAPDGVAGKNGEIKVGDMIQAVNGQVCNTYDDVINCIRNSGKTVELTLLRKHVGMLLSSKMHMQVGARCEWEEFTFKLFSNRELSFEKTQPPAYSGQIDVRLALEVRMVDAPNGGASWRSKLRARPIRCAVPIRACCTAGGESCTSASCPVTALTSPAPTAAAATTTDHNHRYSTLSRLLCPSDPATHPCKRPRARPAPRAGCFRTCARPRSSAAGWYKRGETTSAGFKKRYCVLFSSYRLLYFESEACTKRKGAVDLSVAEAVDSVSTSKGHGFEISTPGRTWVFAAEAQDEMLSWMNTLNTMLGDIGSGRSDSKCPTVSPASRRDGPT